MTFCNFFTFFSSGCASFQGHMITHRPSPRNPFNSPIHPSTFLYSLSETPKQGALVYRPQGTGKDKSRLEEEEVVCRLNKRRRRKEESCKSLFLAGRYCTFLPPPSSVIIAFLPLSALSLSLCGFRREARREKEREEVQIPLLLLSLSHFLPSRHGEKERLHLWMKERKGRKRKKERSFDFSLFPFFWNLRGGKKLAL